MVLLSDNGRVTKWEPTEGLEDRYVKMYNFEDNYDCRDFLETEEEINTSNLNFKCSSWQQFLILFRRSSRQIYRNRVISAIAITKDSKVKFNSFSDLPMDTNHHAYFSWFRNWWTFLSDGE